MKSLLMLFFLASLLHADGYDFPDRCPEIYQNCEVLPLNRHGWYLHGQFRRFFSQKKIKTVVEVGAWTGNNTIYLAGMLPKDGMVFAVDHWLGSKEHQGSRKQRRIFSFTDTFPTISFQCHPYRHGR